MRAKRAVTVCMVLLLAAPAMAQPADGGAGWWGWLAEGWAAVVRVFAADSEEPAEEPAPPKVAEPEGAPDDVTVCLPLAVCPEVGPHIDPDG